MSFTTVIGYDDSNEFTFDERVAVTTDAALADQRPADATLGITYTSGVDANWGGGTLTGAITGAATISQNRLALISDQPAYVDYDGTSNVDNQQTGAFKFIYTPAYTGVPDNDHVFFTVAEDDTSDNNKIELRHNDAGNLVLLITDQANTTIVNEDLGAWSPFSTVPYEFEVNYDITAGATRVFIDGVQKGSTATGTGTRDASIDLLRIGSDRTGTEIPNFYIEDFVAFSTVQNTADYTKGYTLPETIYATDDPTILVKGGFEVDSLSGFITTNSIVGSDDIRYIMRVNATDFYWDGTEWTESDGTYAQANTEADVLANVGAFDKEGTLQLKAFLHSDDGTTTPTLTDVTIDYSFTNAAGLPIPECNVIANLEDLLQDVTDFTTINAVFWVESKATFSHTGQIVYPFKFSQAFDAAGEAQLSVIETTTVSQKLDFYITYTGPDGNARRIQFEPVEVPNQASINLTNLTNVRSI